jgi:hypothetical protein
LLGNKGQADGFKIMIETKRILVLLCVCWPVASCSKREIIRDRLKVGEKRLIMPLALSEIHAVASFIPANVKIKFDVGGKDMPLTGNHVVAFYEEKNAEEPLYQFPVTDLKYMHEDTDCDSQLLPYLANAFGGQAMFCSGTLDITKVSYVKLIRPGKRSKEATSILFDDEDPSMSLRSVIVPFM